MKERKLAVAVRSTGAPRTEDRKNDPSEYGRKGWRAATPAAGAAATGLACTITGRGHVLGPPARGDGRSAVGRRTRGPGTGGEPRPRERTESIVAPCTERRAADGSTPGAARGSGRRPARGGSPRRSLRPPRTAFWGCLLLEQIDGPLRDGDLILELGDRLCCVGRSGGMVERWGGDSDGEHQLIERLQ